MRVQPKTEEQLKEEGQGPRELLRDGVYPFTVSMATEKISSSSGKEMIELKLEVFNADGVAHWVYDYLTDGKMGYKIRHFAETVGLMRQYEQGDMEAADMEGRSGYVNIGCEGARDGFPAKNRVVDYCLPKPSARQVSQPKARVTSTDFDDEIPF